MKITLNGQAVELFHAPNLKVVVERFCRDKIPIVAELNGEVIKTPHWERAMLKDGDTVELVSFVGGGS